MAKKDAKFFYEGRPISSDRAIAILKSNTELNMFTKNSDSNSPRVYLTKLTDPDRITIDKNLPKPTSENIVSHIKVMNRHGAKFYFGKEEISFKEALSYVRKNKDSDVVSSAENNTVIITNPDLKK